MLAEGKQHLLPPPLTSLTMHLKTFQVLSFIILIVVLTILVPRALCSDHKFEACAPQSCGNLTSIRYPFWMSSKQESYCGHPSFKITCKSNKYPTLRMSNDDYLITHVDYLNHTFHLANALLYDDTVTCPTPLHNISFHQTPFNFAADDPFFFLLFYNCSSPPKELYAHFPIACDAQIYKNGSSLRSFGDFHVEVFGEWNYSLDLCQSVVAVPVDVDASQGDEGSSYWQMNYMEILRQGFTLNWTAHDCGGCESSSGRCGFENNQFVCFCRDKPHSKSCHDDKGISKKEIAIGVAVAASGSIILLSIILFFFYRQRRKNHRSSPPVFVQNKTSNASSATSDRQTQSRSTYFGVQVFDYKELEEATDDFNPLKELGDGGFGTVYHGKLVDGRDVAVKRLYENNTKRAEQFMNEVEILAHLRHKNLVTLYGCTSRQSCSLLLVYEYIPNGTVADHLHGTRSGASQLSWSTRLNIAVETARALVYLHSSDVIHRDVKTQNILLDKDFTVKVADFGLSRLFPVDVTHVSTAPQGTPGYVDPEYHQCYQLTEKSDVYSFGVVLAELISSMPAVDITRARHDINLFNMLISKIQNRALHEFVDPSLGFETDSKVKEETSAVAELAFRCLQGTRDMRPSMEEVLEVLCQIQGEGKINGDDNNKADVVDIPSDDVFMLKSDSSPGSTPRDDNSLRRYTPYASV